MSQRSEKNFRIEDFKGRSERGAKERLEMKEIVPFSMDKKLENSSFVWPTWLITSHISLNRCLGNKKSSNYEWPVVSRADHLIFLVLNGLNILIEHWRNIWVKFLLSSCFCSFAVVPQRALELNSPFVILSAAVVPPIRGDWQPILLGCKVRNPFFDELIGGIFEGSLIREANSDGFGAEWDVIYVAGLNYFFYLREDMKGSCERSFWLKLSRKKEIFLHKWLLTCCKPFLVWLVPCLCCYPADREA